MAVNSIKNMRVQGYLSYTYVYIPPRGSRELCRSAITYYYYYYYYCFADASF